MWSAGAAIRARREAFGLSLASLAERIGVTSSFLSLVERGKRQPSDKQAKAIADLLDVPAELLLLGSGRLPDDVVGAIRTNAAEAAAAIRQQTEQTVVAFPRQPIAIKRSARTKGLNLPPASEDIPVSVKVGKGSTAYRAHSYHTKVPPEAIIPFIRAYTSPGDTIADPFCGSGMTGVASLQEGRSAYLSDLSPAAVHIARNYATYCDPKEFKNAYDKVAAHVSTTMAWLYRPMAGDRRNIEYTTWSDLFSCPKCGSDILYWDVRSVGEGHRIPCPACGEPSRKADLVWQGEIPVETHVASGKNRIETRPANAADLALIAETERAPIPYWTPTAEFGPDREMWRASHAAMGITDAAHFFTRRNLHALAALRHAIFESSSGRARDALMFAFTASVNRASKRYQWNAKRPTNVMTGTLYVSSLRYEWNVWSLFRRKAADVLKYYQSFARTDAAVEVFQRSATDLSCLGDGSVDMVFMDPPFGSNIYYADSSLLWEAWLGALTPRSAEMVVSGDRKRVAEAKGLAEYSQLMRQSFAEVARIVRKGGRSVLAFSNSNDAVWEAVQDAISDAGLGVAAVHLLDKGQPSIKGVKGLLGKEHVTRLDLMLCLEKAPRGHRASRPAASEEFINAEIDAVLRSGGGATDAVYSAVLRSALAAGLSVQGITMPAIEARCREIGARQIEGIWRRETPAMSAGDFVSGYLTPPTALPRAKGDKNKKHLPQVLRTVQGSRSSPAYLAHSYHTKVPPEAIAPYIENFSRPGDVVLDPFCGSGMTGVAASGLSRRSILNDLSPAAVHLAWNHTRACDPNRLVESFSALEGRVSKEFARLYRTVDESGNAARIHWTLWSTVHRCPACAFAFPLWDVVDRESGRLGRSMTCPKCQETADRRRFTVLESRPAWIAFEREDGSRGERAATSKDVKQARSFKRSEIPTWWPDVRLGAEREMFQRCALHLHGIESVADLYTPRNLRALSLIWSAIQAEPDERLRRALAFAFTNTAWHGTKMRRFNARGGQRPLTGTLYVPQLSSEANVLEVMRNKIGQLSKFYSSFDKSIYEPAIVLGSATNLQDIADGSVDYIFTDPPFGSNIFYADCNLIWESWLGRVTDPTLEAVVNRSLPQTRGGKSLDDYKSLMTDAMREMARTLKPGGWATVVFHNTDAAVWAAIQAAATSAGFEFHEASSLDRKQQSHKGYKGRGGQENVAHFDVVMSLRKPLQSSNQSVLPLSRSFDDASFEEEVHNILRDPDIAKRGVQGVHAEIMRRRASSADATFVSFGEVRAVVERVSGRPTRKRRATAG